MKGPASALCGWYKHLKDQLLHMRHPNACIMLFMMLLVAALAVLASIYAILVETGHQGLPPIDNDPDPPDGSLTSPVLYGIAAAVAGNNSEYKVLGTDLISTTTTHGGWSLPGALPTRLDDVVTATPSKDPLAGLPRADEPTDENSSFGFIAATTVISDSVSGTSGTGLGMSQVAPATSTTGTQPAMDTATAATASTATLSTMTSCDDDGGGVTSRDSELSSATTTYPMMTGDNMFCKATDRPHNIYTLCAHVHADQPGMVHATEISGNFILITSAADGHRYLHMSPFNPYSWLIKFVVAGMELWRGLARGASLCIAEVCYRAAALLLRIGNHLDSANIKGVQRPRKVPSLRELATENRRLRWNLASAMNLIDMSQEISQMQTTLIDQVQRMQVELLARLNLAEMEEKGCGEKKRGGHVQRPRQGNGGANRHKSWGYARM